MNNLVIFIIIKREDGDTEKDRPIAQYVVYKTFMNKSDLADVQLIAIDKSHDEIWRQSAPILQKLINGTEILTRQVTLYLMSKIL